LLSRSRHSAALVREEEIEVANINDCIPGRRARLLHTGVARVAGKTGTIVEVSRVRRPPGGPLQEHITVDVPGHGEIVLTPADLEVLGDQP
jgi:hypothetical protein